MRRFCLAAFVLIIVLVAGVSAAEECKRLGVRDCRPGTSNKNICYWWECQQTGSLMQMIFTGQTCTCPRRSALDISVPGQAAGPGPETAIAEIREACH
jgi:hypothetical protein